MPDQPVAHHNEHPAGAGLGVVYSSFPRAYAPGLHNVAPSALEQQPPAISTQPLVKPGCARHSRRNSLCWRRCELHSRGLSTSRPPLWAEVTFFRRFAQDDKSLTVTTYAYVYEPSAFTNWAIGNCRPANGQTQKRLVTTSEINKGQRDQFRERQRKFLPAFGMASPNISGVGNRGRNGNVHIRDYLALFGTSAFRTLFAAGNELR